jgi:hypothetical protein
MATKEVNILRRNNSSGRIVIDYIRIGVIVKTKGILACLIILVSTLGLSACKPVASKPVISKTEYSSPSDASSNNSIAAKTSLTTTASDSISADLKQSNGDSGDKSDTTTISAENKQLRANRTTQKITASQDITASPASPKSSTPVEFDANRALKPVKYLSESIGKRFAGTSNENKSATYLRDEMKSLGLTTSIQSFKLPNNTCSYNVVATLPAKPDTGSAPGGQKPADKKPMTIILGGHYDSKVGPGANDNASGVGALIEIARIAGQQQTRPYTLRFVFFGSEERVGSNPNNHHFGSRYYVKHMTSADKKSTSEMICVDMVANGEVLTLRSLKKAPGALSKKFLHEADLLGIPNVYKQAGDDSDFEAFERAGITTSWLEWRPGYYWHTQKDTYDRLNKNCLLSTGRLLQKYLFN